MKNIGVILGAGLLALVAYWMFGKSPAVTGTPTTTTTSTTGNTTTTGTAAVIATAGSALSGVFDSLGGLLHPDE